MSLKLSLNSTNELLSCCNNIFSSLFTLLTASATWPRSPLSLLFLPLLSLPESEVSPASISTVDCPCSESPGPNPRVLKRTAFLPLHLEHLDVESPLNLDRWKWVENLLICSRSLLYHDSFLSKMWGEYFPSKLVLTMESIDDFWGNSYQNCIVAACFEKRRDIVKNTRPPPLSWTSLSWEWPPPNWRWSLHLKQISSEHSFR